MTIYEIDFQLEELVDQETGELLDLEAFEQLHMERGRKIEGMALWYKNMAAEAEAIKAEYESLLKRKKALDNRAERLREYVGSLLSGEKFSTPRCQVTLRSSSSLDVSDAAALIEWAERTKHTECVRYKPPELDKKAITDLLKQGVQVPCAEIKSKKNVRIT